MVAGRRSVQTVRYGELGRNKGGKGKAVAGWLL